MGNGYPKSEIVAYLEPGARDRPARRGTLSEGFAGARADSGSLGPPLLAARGLDVFGPAQIGWRPKILVQQRRYPSRAADHLALVTDNMRMTLDFYVRVLGMPIVHGLRTPSRPPGASHTHGNGAPPYANIPHYFLDMGGDSLLAFFEYPKVIAKVDRDAIGAMQHVSFASGPRRYREILERLKANGVSINAGPLLVIPPAVHSFIFLIPTGSGSRSALTSTATRRICKSSDPAA